MNRALYAGLSGTVANQAYIDVLGNNIANANTVGYKEGRVTFQDAYYQTLQGGRAGASAGAGGVNPTQIGSGVSVGQVQTVHTQGSLRYSGSPLDAAIEGNGMFVLQNGESQLYTRDGSFALDSTNTLVSGSSGLKVQGWTVQGGEMGTGAVADMVFPIGQVQPGVATSAVSTGGNLDASLEVGGTQNATISVYDSLGNAHGVTLAITRNATANQWTCTAQLGADTASSVLTFDPSTGALTGGSPLHLSANVASGAASPLAIDIDLSQVTQLVQSGSNVIAKSQNGRPSSTLIGVDIIEGGDVQGEFSDGHVESVGRLALATFDNVGGLVRSGENLYRTGANTGAVDIGSPGLGNRGDIRAGQLENSNVDLTQSFVEIMTAQRGFQASTKVISTANRLLDDVMQLNIS